MRRSFVVMFVSLAVLGQALSHGQTPVPEPTLSFSCSTFPSTASEADLLARFGKANVTTAPVPWGGAEGDYNEGTVLFAGTPDAKVQIYWRERVVKRLPEWVSVFGKQSRWRTPGGITLGTALTTIEKLNRRPFRLIGFANDVEGTVVSWSGGQLETQDQKDCRVRIRVRTRFGVSPVPMDSVRQVEGEREYSSAHPAMHALDPTVYELFLQYVRLAG